MVGVVVGALLSLTPPHAGAVVQPMQVDTTVTTAVTGPASTPAPDQVDAGDDASTVVGDPAADRRIRRIVIGLCAVALAVLIVTVLFWRATRPVPRALRGLQELGSRSGRRRRLAAAASEAAPEPVAAPVSPALVPAAGAASLPDDG